MMNKKLILLGCVAALFMGCNQTKKENTYSKVAIDLKENIEVNNTLSDEGYTLLKNNCYVCHNPNAASHDAIIAPPFKAVKMHYTREYDTKEDFVKAMVNWVQNPTEENVLMKGAVNRFNIMPKLPLPTKDLEKIASYIYDNDVDEPEWMADHMKEMKGKNGMKGNGNKN